MRSLRLSSLNAASKRGRSPHTGASSRPLGSAKGRTAKSGLKASALSSLKAKREEKATRAKRRATDIKDNVDIEASSSDSDQWDSRSKKRSRQESPSEKMEAWSTEKDRKPSGGEGQEGRKEAQVYPTLDEINSIKLDRSLLEKWVDQPFFEKTVPQFFVRVSIGMDREQQSAYRMAQIVAAEKTPKTYTLGKKKTQYVLKLSHGSSSKNFSIEYISNSPITLLEYQRWLREMERADLEVLTPEDVRDKLKQIENTRNYVYTHEDIERMIQEKSQLRARPVNLAATKALLIQQRDGANTEEEAAAVTAELERINELDRRESQKKQEKRLNISNINKRNKAQNMVMSHVANQASTASNTADPFSRRPTAPSIHIFSKSTAPQVSSSSSSSSSAPTEKAEADLLKKTEAKTPVPPKTSKQEKKDKEEPTPESVALLHSLDIDVDINNLASSNVQRPIVPARPGAPARKSLGVHGTTPKPKPKAISLDDYKRRRGLI